MNNSDPKRMLILDFDGVIVDTELVHFESWNAAFEESFGVMMSGDHRQIIGLSLDQFFDKLAQENVLSVEALTDEQKRNLLERKTLFFYEIGAQRLEAMPGIDNLIEDARKLGWYVAVASRSRRLRLLRTLTLVGLATPFDLILATEDVVNEEVDRKEHARAAHVFGIDPAICIVIEDSPSGVDDAILSGIGHVIGLTTSFDRKALLAAGAHDVVDSLRDVVLE